MNRREFIAAACAIAVASPSQVRNTTDNRKIPIPPAWPSYNGTQKFVGTSASGRVTVWVDASLGQPAVQNAIALVFDADRIVSAIDKIFGSHGQRVDVIIFALGGQTDGTGGGDHMGCDYVTGGAIEVCASYGSPARVSALFADQLSECSMGGNLCGVSTGEALARWCADVISNNALADFSTAPQWAKDGMANYVNTTDLTDQNALSTGCGMAFLSWLMSVGHGLDKIAPALVSLGASGTLAQLYANMTQRSVHDAWPAFQAAIKAKGGPEAVTSDDPFGQLEAQQVNLVIGGNVSVDAEASAKIEDAIRSEDPIGSKAPIRPAGKDSQNLNSRWWLEFWHEQHGAVLTTLGCFSILVLYLGYFATMLLLAPARLAKLGGASGIGEIPKPGGTLGWIVSLGRLGMENAALPWFVRHPRVRKAWSREYRNGHVKVEDLGKPAREAFLKETEVLDVWVESKIIRVRRALDNLDLFDRRQIYVDVPVKLGSHDAARIIERLRPEDLRDTFARPRALVPIIGTGGSGKSTLACAMARWAMADDPTTRLSAHRMVPVFVVQDTADLLDAVTRNLREMLGDDELPADLVRSLLFHQRILVIIDALSEREVETQRHIEQVFKDIMGVVFNAVIITSRVEPEVGAVERTTLYPLRLDTKHVVPFIVDYLSRLKNAEPLQRGDAQLDLGKRILAIAAAGDDETPVTPLLVTLFVDSAVRRTAAGQSLESMPHAVPEIFVDYLRRVKAGRSGEAGVTEETFIAAAQCLAAVSLGSNYVPGDFMPADAIVALKAAGFSESAAALLDRLVAGGVIERRLPGGVPVLRFSLDPAAEYLAAIRQIFILRQGGTSAFEGHFVKLREIDGFPNLLGGYLAAFESCYRAYKSELRLPEISLPGSS